MKNLPLRVAGLLAALAFPLSAATYTQDFDAFADGTTDLADGSTIASNIDVAGFPNGPAQVIGGELQITQDDVNSQRASFRIPALADSSQGWTATFDFTLADAPGGNPPADGYSFNYGAIPAFVTPTVAGIDPNGIAAPTGHGVAEEGWGAVEHISFEADTWQVGDGEHGLNIAGNVGGLQQDFAFLNADVIVDGQTLNGSAELKWSPVTGASMSLDLGDGNGMTVFFENVSTGTFTGDDSYSFAFCARTGGANEQVNIDNLVIETGAADTDDDGMTDEWEVLHALDPADDGSIDPVNGPAGNPDGDTLTNIEEFDARTDPREEDSDGDNLEDGSELAGAGDRPPTNPNNPDTDGDGINDDVETNTRNFVDAANPGTDPTSSDTDGDSFPDIFEIARGTDPNDASSRPATPGGDTYEQSFDDWPEGTTDLADGTTIGSSDGTTQVVGNALRITSSLANSTRGSFRIPAIAGSSLGWTASFDYTLTDAVGGNPPADGFSFTYGDIPALVSVGAAADGHGAAEAGHGSGNEISYQIDTWQNGNANSPGVGLLLNGTSFARTDGTLLPNDESRSGTMTISWNPADTSFMTTGLETNAEFDAVPHTFTGDDSFSWVFSARTGGATQDLIIDNLVITTGAGGNQLEIIDIQYVIDPTDGLADVTITWASRENRTYILYASDDATALLESDLEDGIESDGETTSFIHENIDPATTPLQLYRVAEESNQ